MEFVLGKQFLTFTLGEQNNSILVSYGDNTTGQVENGQAQYFQQFGFCSLPPEPINGVEAADVIIMKGAGNLPVITHSRHVSAQKVYANMDYGDAIMYAASSDGSTKTRIKCNAELKTAVMMTSDSDNKDVQLSVSPDGLSFFFQWGKMIFDQTGFHITTISGGEFHLGNMNASIGPIGISSQARLKADLINCVGLTKVGTGPVYFAPVISPVPSVTTGTPTATPVVIPIIGQGITSTQFLVGA